MPFKERLKEIIEDWFHSDLDIQFILKRGREKLLCSFESDAWYEHINDPERGVTVKSVRHGGERRRLIAWEGSDRIYEEITTYLNRLYTKDELLSLVEELNENYQILSPEEWG